MDTTTDLRRRADLRDYLAAERTLLAWVRTGLALMGLGFVVARFGLFVQQLEVVPARAAGILARALAVVWHRADRCRSGGEFLFCLAAHTAGP